MRSVSSAGTPMPVSLMETVTWLAPASAAAETRTAPPCRREFQGIVDKIGYHLMNALRVRIDVGESWRQIDDQVDAASCGERLQSFDRRQYSFTDRYGLETEGNLPGFDA